MIVHRQGRLTIESDYEIRIIREEGEDMDLFIPLDCRTLNLHLDSLPVYLDDRIQFNEIRNIIVRYSTDENNNYCTIHLLKNIDLHSAVANFIINYENHKIILENKEFSSEMYIKRKTEK